MPVIRFVREGRDVECYPGENLREVALREGIALYGLKGQLGNCGGCGQCITCFVELPESTSPLAMSGRTAVEDQKLRGRPQNWRLACQALVQECCQFRQYQCAVWTDFAAFREIQLYGWWQRTVVARHAGDEHRCLFRRRTAQVKMVQRSEANTGFLHGR